MTRPTPTPTPTPARFWTRLEVTAPEGGVEGAPNSGVPESPRIRCDLCPRYCKLREGQRGFCFVRGVQNAQMVLHTWGRSTGFCIDPIEKKPLNHFLPGTPTLSFGTAGCNLGCKFCQNWDISKSRQVDRLSDVAYPDAIARAAVREGCRSVAFTYNDPVIWAEYALDVAAACRAAGLRTVGVTAGYITEQAREPFFGALDAVNIDLKAFDEGFYRDHCAGSLEPVLDTLRYVHEQTDCWLEVTTLVIPGLNDDDASLAKQAAWMAEHLGPDVPLHFSAFHPDFRMRDRPRTPPQTLTRAREIAREHGLRYVYTGNVRDQAGDATRCHHCDALLIQRDRYSLLHWNLADGRCGQCATAVAGVFEARPGAWGAKRRPVMIA